MGRSTCGAGRTCSGLTAPNRGTVAVFASIALFFASKHGVRLAFELQVIDPEWVPVARRSFNMVLGGLMAVWGNYLPKLLLPWQPDEEPFDWHRVGA